MSEHKEVNKIVKDLNYFNAMEINIALDKSFIAGERRGRVEELIKLVHELRLIGNEDWLSTDYHEGRKDCIKLIEKRLLELGGKP